MQTQMNCSDTIFCCVKEVAHKRAHAAWIHLCKAQEQVKLANSDRRKKSSYLPKYKQIGEAYGMLVKFYVLI
jgi:hypothetical protein